MKYVLRVYTKDGDSYKVWTEAESLQEAISEIKREYWDADRVEKA